MVLRTYFTKNNTIISNSNLNTGKNPVAELYYGGPEYENQYSRMLFHFDESRLKSFYTGGTFTDLSKLTHILRIKNTTSYDNGYLNKKFGEKDRATSFDLILFKLNQPWDEGIGYDYSVCGQMLGECASSLNPSNWIYATTGVNWSGGSGVYSGSSSAITIATQHFSDGNEDIELDITSFVNSVLTGGTTNYGLGLAFARGFEDTLTFSHQYVGFFTRHTQTFYEPYLDTIYSNHITDNRNDFFLDKINKLYLYVNLAGQPTNLDALPSVTVYDNAGLVFSSITQSGVTHVTKGVYSIDISVPSTSDYIDSTMFTDEWSGLTINGIQRPVSALQFALKDSAGYYNIGSGDVLPKKVGVSISGLKSNEKIKRGDIRKVLVSMRIPYTVEQTQLIDNAQYRLYVTEGKNELTVVDFHPLEMASNHSYFLLDTQSLIPNTYYLDIRIISDLEVSTIKEVVKFDIVSESNLRKSQ